MINQGDLTGFAVQLMDLRVQLSMLSVDERCLSDDEFGKMTSSLMTNAIALEDRLNIISSEPLRFELDLASMTSRLEQVNEVVSGVLIGGKSADSLNGLDNELRTLVGLMPQS